MKNGVTLTETTDYTISGKTLTLVVAALDTDATYVVSPSSRGVPVATNGCTVVGLDVDRFSTGVLAGPTALANTVQAGNSGSSGSAVATLNISGGVPRLQVVNAGANNVDLHLVPAGTGMIRFGTRTANADAPVNGYVSIKGADGGLIALATIA
ncbi:hypothetical protein [Arthrobacter sp. AQ5-05]|uniref:hypothetical protein n=1 Tax=Arthrobacter sp. AQ5-05 TaxID=2184581 RepID=UPI0012B528F2|nr:hypothetical protein [Arthrobacter sp. AQ5-05]